MSPARPAVPLPPMPLWLRLLGVGVCLTPLVVGLAFAAVESKDAQEFIGGIGFLVFFLFYVILILLVPMLAPPLCWSLGWRPGALFCSGYLLLVGLSFLSGDGDFDRPVGGLLLLHLPLLGLLIWEWRTAIRRRRQLTAALPPPSAPV